MAMYHCSVKTIGRSGGSNVVNSAAYRSGEKLYEQQLDKTFYYSGKAMDVMHKEIMAPDKSPEWVKDRERRKKKRFAISKRSRDIITKRIYS